MRLTQKKLITFQTPAMNNWNLKVKLISFMLVQKRVILEYEQNLMRKTRILMKEIKKDLIKK